MATERKYKRVAVLMGGPSSEREVSLRSGAAVTRGLCEAGYDASGLDLTGTEVALPAGIEAVFVALHGVFGEDGQVQAALERMGVPYTGSGPEASRVSFDKVLSKCRMAAQGVPTPAYEVLGNGRARTLPLPLVLKPARQGSSIGVHRVLSEDQWAAALADARIYGDDVVAESYIEGRELTVGIVGREVLPVVEIVAPEGWYDYRVKYTQGACRYRVPAPLDAETVSRAQAIALRTFDALGCRGLGRVDFRMAADGSLYVLELNNIPGFTETSLLPKAAACGGMSFPELCGRIMEMAQVRAPEPVLSGRG